MVKEVLEEVPQYRECPARAPEKTLRQNSRRPADRQLRSLQQLALYVCRMAVFCSEGVVGERRLPLQQLFGLQSDLYFKIEGARK